MGCGVSSEHEQVKIRRASEADLTAIAGVLVDTWRTTFRGLLPDRFLDNMSYAQQRERHLRYMADQKVFYLVAACGPTGEVIGFANGGPIRDRDFPYASELYAIYIRQEFQGRGIGRRLFCALVDQLSRSGLSSMIVWVLVNNPNHSFYERKSRLGNGIMRTFTLAATAAA